MCIAFPGKIAELKGNKAVIDYGQELREAVNPIGAKKGDWVLVQFGMVSAKLTEKDALETLQAMQKTFI